MWASCVFLNSLDTTLMDEGKNAMPVFFVSVHGTQVHRHNAVGHGLRESRLESGI